MIRVVKHSLRYVPLLVFSANLCPPRIIPIDWVYRTAPATSIRGRAHGLTYLIIRKLLHVSAELPPKTEMVGSYCIKMFDVSQLIQTFDESVKAALGSSRSSYDASLQLPRVFWKMTS